jgi:hypothetical protein
VWAGPRPRRHRVVFRGGAHRHRWLGRARSSGRPGSGGSDGTAPCTGGRMRAARRRQPHRAIGHRRTRRGGTDARTCAHRRGCGRRRARTRPRACGTVHSPSARGRKRRGAAPAPCTGDSPPWRGRCAWPRAGTAAVCALSPSPPARSAAAHTHTQHRHIPTARTAHKDVGKVGAPCHMAAAVPTIGGIGATLMRQSVIPTRSTALSQDALPDQKGASTRAHELFVDGLHAAAAVAPVAGSIACMQAALQALAA